MPTQANSTTPSQEPPAPRDSSDPPKYENKNPSVLRLYDPQAYPKALKQISIKIIPAQGGETIDTPKSPLPRQTLPNQKSKQKGSLFPLVVNDYEVGTAMKKRRSDGDMP